MVEVLLVTVALIAVVAIGAAAVAMRSVARLRDQVEALQNSDTHQPVPPAPAPHPSAELDVRPVGMAPRVLQGRVFVPPTQSQVVRTALGRPGVRLNVFVHGLAHALRPENRDRIVALMRREYRHRRRERLSIGRSAIRLVRPTSAPTTAALHDHLLEPRQPSLAERMIDS